MYGDREVFLFSVPGRTELSGNHTDHNGGKVLAAAVDLDLIAVAAKAEGHEIRIKSEGYREDVVDLRALAPEKIKPGSSHALIAGVCAALRASQHSCGGFVACTTSDVLSGSGLSSSAAFEVMCGRILSAFYNADRIPPMTLAQAGKFAENDYFGKPCGLMDQAACAHGGMLYIDFASAEEPVTEKLSFSPEQAGWALCIVNTGGNHADLTEDYASVPHEMKSCAALLGKKQLRECDEAEFMERVPYLRKLVGDRAVLRALHFFAENRRVEAQREAIRNGDVHAFLAGVTDSGNSSFKYLQNVYTVKNTAEQGLSLALALSEQAGAVCRVHGGGFAGTVQAYVPSDRTELYRRTLEHVFGPGACMFLQVRPYGAARITESGILE